MLFLPSYDNLCHLFCSFCIYVSALTSYCNDESIQQNMIRWERTSKLYGFIVDSKYLSTCVHVNVTLYWCRLSTDHWFNFLSFSSLSSSAIKLSVFYCAYLKWFVSPWAGPLWYLYLYYAYTTLHSSVTIIKSINQIIIDRNSLNQEITIQTWTQPVTSAERPNVKHAQRSSTNHAWNGA